MQKVTIQGNDYLLRDMWDDITLSQFSELLQIPIPAKLKKRWLNLINDKDEELNETHREIVKVFPEYFGKVIGLFSDIPADVIKYIDWSLREKLFNEYLLHFSITTIAPAPFDLPLAWLEPRYAFAFTFKGETFYLPESLMYGGVEIPQKKEKIATFAESSDISIALNEWAERGIEAMAQVCAVYLRKEGEEHSDELVIRRSEEFKELPMSVVWEVFFCICALGQRYSRGIESYLSTTLESMIKQLENPELMTSESVV